MNQALALHIDKPFTEVPSLQRRQWVLQVLALTQICATAIVPNITLGLRAFTPTPIPHARP